MDLRVDTNGACAVEWCTVVVPAMVCAGSVWAAGWRVVGDGAARRTERNGAEVGDAAAQRPQRFEPKQVQSISETNNQQQTIDWKTTQRYR